MGNSINPLAVAVPDLGRYSPDTGIGRVFADLADAWGERVRLLDARFAAPGLPVLRNLPTRVRVPAGADVVFLPKLTSSQALADTGGLPSVAVVHDVGIVDYPGDRSSLDWLSYQIVLRGLAGLRHASRVIAVSEFTRDRLLKHIPALEGRVTVVHNAVRPIFAEAGLSVADARHRLTERLASPLGHPVLLYVGTELPRKNLLLLLTAFTRVKRRYPTAQLLKVGQPGHPKWRNRTLAEASGLGLSLERDLLFLDRVDDAALVESYHAADVFVSASLYEGFGLPAVEAMASGTPVVVCSRASFPEVVGDGGFVVDAEVGPLAEAIGRAIGEPRDSQRTRKGRARAAMFEPSRSADRYLEVLKEVVVSRRADRLRQGTPASA